MPSKSKVVDPLAKVSVTFALGDALYLARAGVAATASDDMTPVITGVLFSATDGVVKVVSTDRYRIHRATVAVDGVAFPPFLVPAKALKWFIANASYFGRGVLEAVARFEFDTMQRPEPTADGRVPTPSGRVTVTILESDSEGAAYLAHATDLIAGHFPARIETLLDEALKADAAPGDKGTLDLDFLAKCRALAAYRGERPRVHFIAGSKSTGQAVVQYKQGVAVIQKGPDL